MKFSFNLADVFGPQDAYEGSEVLMYVGKIGYFGDGLDNLQKSIEKGDSGNLRRVVEGSVYSYQWGINQSQATTMFLPADKVIQPKPQKLRPIKTFSEFMGIITHSPAKPDTPFRYVSVMIRRNRQAEDGYSEKVVSGLRYSAQGELCGVTLGATPYTPGELLNDWEIWSPATEKWVPIGVLEEPNDE